MKFLLMVLFIGSTLAFAQTNTIPQNLNTKEKVGSIAFDSSRDREDFTVCDELNIEEYYQVNPRFSEGMPSIQEYFASHISSLNKLVNQDGYITIRFVINCQGETDRYRCFFVDRNYQSVTGNSVLEAKLIELVSAMGKWTPGEYEGKNYDAYQHLKFRVLNKEIVDILF